MEASELPHPEMSPHGEHGVLLVPEYAPPPQLKNVEKLIVYPTRAHTVDNLAAWTGRLAEDGRVVLYDWTVEGEEVHEVVIVSTRSEFLRFCEDPWTDGYLTAYESLDQEGRLGELGRGFRHWRKTNPGSGQEDG